MPYAKGRREVRVERRLGRSPHVRPNDEQCTNNPLTTTKDLAHTPTVSSCCLEGEAELPSVSALRELWNRLLYRDRHRDTSSKTASRFLSGRAPDFSGYGTAPLSTADAFPQAWIQVHAPPQRTSTSSRRGGPRRDLGSMFPRTTPNCAAA